MQGGPAAFETFVHKKLSTTISGKQHGESGTWVCKHFPYLSKWVDKLCFLNGMHSDSPVHSNAQIQLHCGLATPSRPSMGSWISYGLGSENIDLPGYIHLGASNFVGGSRLSSSAFLPSEFTGIPINSQLKLEDFGNAKTNFQSQRKLLDLVQKRNKRANGQVPQNNHLHGVIESYEMAYRMQGSLPNLLNTEKESKQIKDQYGLNNSQTSKFGKLCLAARKLSESGVRFVEVNHRNWDHHNSIQKGIPKSCGETDKPIAALLKDLEQRGLLDETIVLWGGEFGRLPGDKSGHNPKGYTMWMAGAGLKKGFSYGETDERGIEAVDGKVHVHDLHATILHLLGIDHERLTYSFAGRDWRLTDVKGNLIKPILS